MSSNSDDSSFSAYQTAMFGLSLTVLCLVGATGSLSSSSSSGLDDYSPPPTTGLAASKIVNICYNRTALWFLEACRKIAFPVQFLLSSLHSLPAPEDSDSNDDSDEEEIDMTVIDHRGCCQCESVVFQIKAPRTLKEECPPAWLEDEEDDGTSPKKLNSFPKTLIPFSNLGIIHGSEHLRNYQKPSAAARQRQQQYQHPLALVAIPKDLYQNKNMIKTFCGRCGTHVFWKSPHDVSRQVYVNLHCLQSDWRPMPPTLASPKRTAIVARSAHKKNRRKHEVPTDSSKTKLQSPAATPKSSRNKSPPSAATHGSNTAATKSSSSLTVPPRPNPTSQTSIEPSSNTPNQVTPPRNHRGRSNSLIREPSLLTDDETSWVDKPPERPTDASETASTITLSSNSVVWRLRDPNSSQPIPSPSNRSVASAWEERLADELSQDALLYQMRKHLASHSSLAESPPKPNDNSVSALNSTGEGPRVFLPAE